MPTTPIQSYRAQVRTTPPSEKTFPAGSDAAAALRTARSWVEDQARAFIEEHSMPHNPRDAGAIFAVEGEKATSGEPLVELDVYTSEGEFVFDWDDED